MKQIQSVWWSNLSTESINDLICILLCSQEIMDFNPREAIKLRIANKWTQGHRATFMDEDYYTLEEDMVCTADVNQSADGKSDIQDIAQIIHAY